MKLQRWLTSNVEYGRKLVASGYKGASAGQQSFLAGRTLKFFLDQAARQSLSPAAAGVCIGALGGYLSRRSRPGSRAWLCALAGGTLGFGIGFSWRTRRLAADIAGSALRGMDTIRDERWFERNPIDYA